MKNQKILSILFILSFLSISSIYSQRINTWIGGSPGHETNWNYHKNWSLNEVPDWTSDVIIPNMSSSARHYPKIKEGEAEVNSLRIFPGAKLHVSVDASLLVLTEDNYGILNQGALVIDGTMEFGTTLLNQTILLEEQLLVAAQK